MRRQRNSKAILFTSLLVPLVLGATSSRSFAAALLSDGWSVGQPVAFQAGFTAGEVVAATFVPPGPCPCEVTRIAFLYGGGDATRTVSVRLWNDTALSLEPGDPLFFEIIEVSAADDTLQVLDFGSEPIVVDGAFRVGIGFQNEGLPSIGADTDGTITESRNFVFTGDQWFQSSEVGIDGDWIIRAEVSDSESPPCAQPVTTGDGPKSSDCLFILRTAVGSATCEPVCICDPNGSGGVSTSDALVCLRKAVGQDVALGCDCD
jgi:hypothetical protein